MRMLRRRWSTLAFLLVGIALLGFVYLRIYTPTVTVPNYWENNTGGLVPLMAVTALAGVSLAGGLFLGVDWLTHRVTPRLTPRRIQMTGLCLVLGGLLWVSVSHPPLPRLLPRVRVAGIQLAAVLLFIAGIVGLYARYWPEHDARPRHGTALLASGLVVLTAAAVLRRLIWYVPVRTGALRFPTQVLDAVGFITLLAGTVLLGIALWHHDSAPRWLGVVVLSAGTAVLFLGVGKYPIRVLWRIGPLLGYGIMGVLAGIHLSLNPHPTSPSDTRTS